MPIQRFSESFLPQNAENEIAFPVARGFGYRFIAKGTEEIQSLVVGYISPGEHTVVRTSGRLRIPCDSLILSVI